MLSRAVCELAELLCCTHWVFPLSTQVPSLVTQEPQALEAQALPGQFPGCPRSLLLRWDLLPFWILPYKAH